MENADSSFYLRCTSIGKVLDDHNKAGSLKKKGNELISAINKVDSIAKDVALHLGRPMMSEDLTTSFSELGEKVLALKIAADELMDRLLSRVNSG